MPQANITYDAPYNQRLVALLREMDEKQDMKSYPARTPTPMGMRMGSYHGDLVGGGSSPMMYNPPGNSVAYPPLSLPAGMDVHSGGALIGVDGAVGGKYTAKKFFRDLGHGAKVVGKHALSGLKAIAKNKEVQAVGKELLKEGVKQGTKALIEYATTGAGRKKRAPRKKKGTDLAEVIEETKGGKYSVGKFFKDTGKVLGKVAKNPIVKQVGKELLKEGLKQGTKALLSGAGKGGRSARAEIVKKVMKEKGLKMIEASKYVKEHGLY
jgi:hypothetical protein